MPSSVAIFCAVVDDLAGGRPFQAQNAAAGRGLAATALADEAKRFAAGDGEVDAVDGFDFAGNAAADDALGDREMHPQAAHGQQRFAHAAALKQAAE